MKISDYEKVQDLHDADAFLVDGDRGTKTILTTHLAKQIFSRIGSKELLDKATPAVLPEDTALEPSDLIAVQTGDGMRKVSFATLTKMYDKMPKTSDEYFEMLDAFADIPMRNIFVRGKDVTNAKDWSSSTNRDAKGLFLGDYVIIPGLEEYPAEIADFTQWEQCSENDNASFDDLYLRTLTFMFRSGPNMAWSKAGSTMNYPYYNSPIRRAISTTFKPHLSSFFGNTLGYFRVRLQTNEDTIVTVSDYVLLPSILDLYGVDPYGKTLKTFSISSTTQNNRISLTSGQLSLFKRDCRYLRNRKANNGNIQTRCWTRDVGTPAYAFTSNLQYELSVFNWYEAAQSSSYKARPMFIVRIR